MGRRLAAFFYVNIRGCQPLTIREHGTCFFVWLTNTTQNAIVHYPAPS